MKASQHLSLCLLSPSLPATCCSGRVVLSPVQSIDPYARPAGAGPEARGVEATRGVCPSGRREAKKPVASEQESRSDGGTEVEENRREGNKEQRKNEQRKSKKE